MARPEPRIVPNPDTHDLAWAAGFIDGEGSFGITAPVKYRTSQGQKTRFYLRFSVAQKYEPLIERLHRMFGIGHTYFYPGSGQRSQVYVWRCNGREAFHVAALVWPWLGEQKKADFKRAIKAIRETRNDFVRRSQRGRVCVLERS